MENINNKHVVAFMDLLGFSELLQNDPEIAFDNMNIFHDVFRTRYIDDKSHPREEYEQQGDERLLNFVDDHAVSAFKEVIFFSDSMIIGAVDANMIVRQLANYLATIYIRYCKPFAKPFTDIKDVRGEIYMGNGIDGKPLYKRTFPILFRGGIAIGDEVGFWDEISVHNGEMMVRGLDVGGRTYLEAVRLEKVGAGPRLFCHKNLMDACDEEMRYIFSDVKDTEKRERDLYEILWSAEGCECGERSSSARKNIYRGVNDMLLPAINLYNYYSNVSNREKTEVNPTRHYKALLETVIKGIVSYGRKCDEREFACNTINCTLDKSGIVCVDSSAFE